MSVIRNLSSVEKKKLEKSLSVIRRLSKQSILSDKNAFILKHRMRKVLQILGEQRPGRIMVARALEIMQDKLPFKIMRLRKLINGRRS